MVKESRFRQCQVMGCNRTLRANATENSEETGTGHSRCTISHSLCLCLEVQVPARCQQPRARRRLLRNDQVRASRQNAGRASADYPPRRGLPRRSPSCSLPMSQWEIAQCKKSPLTTECFVTVSSYQMTTLHLLNCIPFGKCLLIILSPRLP